MMGGTWARWVAGLLAAGVLSLTVGVQTAGAAGAPVTGGTLKIVGSGDVDRLDTCCTHYSTTDELLRAVSRQMVTYATTAGVPDPPTPVPDMATYTESPDGLTYTFTIKQGVKWDAPSGPRQVTSQDEVRGLERLCNPVQPAEELGYVEDLIAGMRAFCSGFSALTLPSNPGKVITVLKNYIQTHQISGLSTPNSSTIEITLSHPSAAFINMMALPMTSPVPVEVLQYLPGSQQEAEHFISDGPYAITAYTAGVSFTLGQNPSWSQSTDPIRYQYVDAIDINEGQDPVTIQQELETGAADLEWDTTVPPADAAALATSTQSVSASIGGIVYVAYNMKNTTDGGALLKPAVRKALEYCPNKRRVMQVSGGSLFNRPSNQILPPQVSGYAKIDPYPTYRNEGNATKCKSLLSSAGYPSGLTLTLAYPDNPPFPAIATALQADFAAAGVTLKLNEQPTLGGYLDYLGNPANGTQWDLALARWLPDWPSAESYFVPLLDGDVSGPGPLDYGGYDDPTVNSQIDTARAAPSAAAADSDWANTDNFTMTNDPPWIPLTWVALPQFVGTRVANAIYNASLGYVDITNLWKTAG